MEPETSKVLELFLIFGVALGWAVWELWTLRRDRRKPAARERAGQSTRGE